MIIRLIRDARQTRKTRICCRTCTRKYTTKTKRKIDAVCRDVCLSIFVGGKVVNFVGNIGVKYAVEVVGFVTDGAREKPLGGEFMFLAVSVAVFAFYLIGARDGALFALDRKTALGSRLFAFFG